MLITIPHVSIKPNYLTTYIYFDNTSSFGVVENSRLVRPLSNEHHGLMSQKANRRVRLAIDWMCLLAKNKHVTADRAGSVTPKVGSRIIDLPYWSSL